MSNFRVALLIETSSGYGRSLLAGIAKFIRTRNDWSVHFAQRDLASDPPRWIFDWDGDGLISRKTPKRLSDVFRKRGIPFVDLQSRTPARSPPMIQTDDESIARLAVAHLLERGFERFAYCGYEGEAWSETRFNAFKEVLRAQGHSQCDMFTTSWFGEDTDAWHAECRRLASWIQKLHKPIGILAGNDILGHSVDSACSQIGVAIPEQVAVLGVDNDPIVCDLCTTPLSSVKSDIESIGYLAAESLAKMMEGNEEVAPLTLVPPLGVKTRQSTDAYATEDQDIMQALCFIRANACIGVTTTDVANHISMSRSTLERRMRDAVGRSPKQQIRHVQLSRVRALLTDSEESINQIAKICGFEHPEYMHVVFKREIGITPGEYRRQPPPV